MQDTKVTRITYEEDITSLVISPDGRSFGYGTIKNGKASLRIRQISGTNSIEIASSNANFLNLAYAPDGNSIFYRQYDEKNEGFIFQIPAFVGTPRRISSDIDGAQGPILDYEDSGWRIWIAAPKPPSRGDLSPDCDFIPRRDTTAVSTLAQGDHRVHFRRAPRRKVAGENGDRK